MTELKKLFLCHHRADAGEVALLARELRLRGIVPWRDTDGGFSLGDENALEARRAIKEDCFGLAFYATPKALERPFIRDVEIPAAIACKQENASFVLFALPRRMGWDQLSQQSEEVFGLDLASYNSRSLRSRYQGRVGADAVRHQLTLVADEVLDKVIGSASHIREDGVLQIQCGTRERLADEPGDVLHIDAVDVLSRHAHSRDAWEDFRQGILDVKRAIAKQLGRPRIRVRGRQHLTAAFALGYTFPVTVAELEVQTRAGYWLTDCPTSEGNHLSSRIHKGDPASEDLYVELGVTGMRVRDAVHRHVRHTNGPPGGYLRLSPARGDLHQMDLDNTAACSIVRQVRQGLASAMKGRTVSTIHMFAAVPQGLAVLIGQQLGAFPPVQLYEFDGRDYHPSLLLRHG
jgi:hypothetical protein